MGVMHCSQVPQGKQASTLLSMCAISAARCGSGCYTLGAREIKVGADEVAQSPDGAHFVGSTATMPKVDRVLRDLGFNDDEVAGLCYERPRRAIGL